MKPLIVSPAAEGDITDAFDWYQDERPGLGGEFLDALRYALTRVTSEPAAFPLVHRDLHRIRLVRFPYSVLFRDQPDAVFVVAVFHGKRDPAVWLRRV